MKTSQRLLGLAVLTSFFFASACVCTNTNGSRGDVTFLWSFNGQPCALAPDVATVSLQIPGQTLDNGGVYNCQTNGTAGIVLLNFRPGTYTFTMQGNTNTGAVAYQANGSFVVNGDVIVNVDLKSAAGATGAALITWRMPNNANCTTVIPGAGEAITSVDVIIDAFAPSRENCVDGLAGSAGRTFSPLTAGSHTIELRAYGASGYQYLAARSTVIVNAGGTAANEFQLGYLVGSLPLKWQFTSNNTARSCANMGNPRVYVNLKDSTGRLVYSQNNGAGYDVPCANDGAIQGTYLPYLLADNYQVILQAYGPGNVLFSTNQVQPPVAVVTAGQFPQLDANTFTLNISNP